MPDSIQTKAALRALFESGDVPIGQDFADWIFTMKAHETPISLTYTDPVVPDCNDGLIRNVALTGDMTISPPTNAVAGMTWEGWVTCDGTARNLSFDAAILIPSDSAFTSPKTLTISKTYIVTMKYNGTNWLLVGIIGGY